jgi:hypothetical protein
MTPAQAIASAANAKIPIQVDRLCIFPATVSDEGRLASRGEFLIPRQEASPHARCSSPCR